MCIRDRLCSCGSSCRLRSRDDSYSKHGDMEGIPDFTRSIDDSLECSRSEIKHPSNTWYVCHQHNTHLDNSQNHRRTDSHRPYVRCCQLKATCRPDCICSCKSTRQHHPSRNQNCTELLYSHSTRNTP
eukprot:TRINITY_DN21397_c0_g1_i2.p3 TRINITY_DN21397_c0_g1~~TRINITY_DN21397_c0_g1_i2.p3  ORF type:complete len:128 (+),score=1.88 TRINITY_DN21397_c0_g1_i2:162-545(+)